MIDVDVLRMRRLRDRARTVRALAMALESDAAPRTSTLSLSTLSRSAQTCWRISRVITGLLRGHPNLSYRRDYSPSHAAYGHVRAMLLAFVARVRGTQARTFAADLRRVARELDDVRALTWSVELSDTLGRVQLQMRRLCREMDVATLLESGANPEMEARVASRISGGRKDPQPVDANWPYLAL